MTDEQLLGLIKDEEATMDRLAQRRKQLTEELKKLTDEVAASGKRIAALAAEVERRKRGEHD